MSTSTEIDRVIKGFYCTCQKFHSNLLGASELTPPPVHHCRTSGEDCVWGSSEPGVSRILGVLSEPSWLNERTATIHNQGGPTRTAARGTLHGGRRDTWTKWTTFCRQHFEMHFLEWKLLHFDSNNTEICSWGASWWYHQIKLMFFTNLERLYMSFLSDQCLWCQLSYEGSSVPSANHSRYAIEVSVAKNIQYIEALKILAVGSWRYFEVQLLKRWY